MTITQILRRMLLVVQIGLAFPLAYLGLLSISALIASRKRRHHGSRIDRSATAQSRFAILVPAHDEEVILATLLGSLAQLDYPAERFTVCVIADNCTDTTAQLARQFQGVQVYERFHETQRGKGYALNWIWQQLEQRQQYYDAYVVLDADSVVFPDFLRYLDRELGAGAQALQACNTVLNGTASTSSALRWVALTLMNHVRPLGRNGIGGSSTLTGNGMCLSRQTLLRFPWTAFGIAEDYQYYLSLMLAGERVQYVPEAVVRSQMPVTFAQMRTQDVRWEAGDAQQSQWSRAFQLLKAAVSRRSLVCLDAVAELLTPPLSFLVACCTVLLIISLALRSLPNLLLNLAMFATLAGYLTTALVLLRAPRIVYKALLRAPGFVLWKIWVYLVLSRSRKHTREWIRTARTSA